MINIFEDAEIKGFMKAISSNLIRAQMEENGDLNKRNHYLELAGLDSISLGRLLVKLDKVESSKYFLNAGLSYEKSGNINRSKTCYEKLLEMDVDEFVDKAIEGLKRLESLHQYIDLETKEGRLAALEYTVWKYKGLNTLEATKYLKADFQLDLCNSTIRSYARELEERKRVTIWGGPQGRMYRIYPNISNLATRKDYYNEEQIITGSIEKRVTPLFEIQFQRWSHNKEIFVVNGSLVPKLLLTVDMNAYMKNFDKLKEGYTITAFGLLLGFQSLSSTGYEIPKFSEYDVLDSEILIDSATNKPIYSRSTREVS